MSDVPEPPRHAGDLSGRPAGRLGRPGDAARVTGTRRLLRRLRDVMAGSGTAQERLDRIVRIIAADMVAEVCSAYVMRAGEVLELFATEGLRPEAVHRTRLRVGEGLVGVIAATARPLALADAQSHPDFAYRPETGEEIYHSLMGVPILRGGRVLGVLVVQNRTLRHYTEDEIEIAADDRDGRRRAGRPAASWSTRWRWRRADGGALLPLRLDGIRLNAGLAIGPAVLHEPQARDPPGRRRGCRGRARAAARARSRRCRARSTSWSRPAAALGAGEHRDIIETYRMFAADRGWLGRITEAVRSGLTAEAAVQKVRDETRTRMMQVSRPVSARAAARPRRPRQPAAAISWPAALSGADASDLPPEFILVARSMGPAELLDYAHRRVKGLVLEEGSPTAHVAIVARAFDIPVVGRVEDATSRIEPGDIVIVDGEHGQVLIRPSEDIQQSTADTVAERTRRRAYLRDACAISRR